MTRRRRAIACAILFVLVACGPTGQPSVRPSVTPAPTATASPPPPSATASPSPVPTARPSPVDDEVNRLIARVAGGANTSGSELDVLWQSILAETDAAGALPYRSPTQLVAYYTGEVPPGECRGDLAVSDWANNAHYCTTDASILYDETWLRDFAARSGPYAPAAIMAHEWGHHVQQLLGVSGYSIGRELQADCMAGLFLANTEEVLPAEPAPEDALDAALRTFFALGNSRYDASRWFTIREHGSAQQRIRAFGTGYAASFVTPDYPPPVGRGLAACYGYRDFMPRDFALIGDYRLINLPGRSETTADGRYEIAPETRLGFPTSAVLLEWLPAATADELVVRYRDRFPGIQVIGEQQPIDLAGSVKPGDGFGYYVEQRAAEVTGGVRSGVIALIEPARGGGALVVFAHRAAPALTEPLDEAEHRTLAEHLATLYEVVARLCTPDYSKDVDDPDFRPVCLDDQ